MAAVYISCRHPHRPGRSRQAETPAPGYSVQLPAHRAQLSPGVLPARPW